MLGIVSRKKVLVVDDDRVNLTVASRMLAKLGCDVHEASSGGEAVEAARAKVFDLILMDWMMHPMDGGAATQLIRRGTPNAGTPIVAVTTWDDPKTCLAAGLDDYLQKPVTMQRLEDMISRWTPATSGCSNPDCPEC